MCVYTCIYTGIYVIMYMIPTNSNYLANKYYIISSVRLMRKCELNHSDLRFFQGTFASSGNCMLPQKD